MKSKALKRQQAAARNLIYAGLTTEQKIALARSRRGESKREIKRLTSTNK